MVRKILRRLCCQLQTRVGIPVFACLRLSQVHPIAVLFAWVSGGTHSLHLTSAGTCKNLRMCVWVYTHVGVVLRALPGRVNSSNLSTIYLFLTTNTNKRIDTLACGILTCTLQVYEDIYIYNDVCDALRCMRVCAAS